LWARESRARESPTDVQTAALIPLPDIPLPTCLCTGGSPHPDGGQGNHWQGNPRRTFKPQRSFLCPTFLCQPVFALAVHHTPMVGKGITGKGIATDIQTAALIPLPTGDCELDVWERAAARPYRVGKRGWMWLRWKAALPGLHPPNYQLPAPISEHCRAISPGKGRRKKRNGPPSAISSL
jgi:hypothetical protein